MLLHGEAAPPGFVAHLLARQELVERDRPVLGPDPAGRAKIRNAAFGRDARAGERHDHARRARSGRAGVRCLSQGRVQSYMLPRIPAVSGCHTRGPHAISSYHAARARSRRRARLLLQQARPQGSPPPRRREGALHQRVPGRPEDEPWSPRASAPGAMLHWSSSPTIGTARTMARRAISATSPTRSTTSTRCAIA